MNILQIGTTDKIGGAASISWSLKKRLEKMRYKMPMFVADKKSNEEDVFEIPRKVHKYVQILLSNDIDYSKTDWIINTKEFKEADIVHLHNLHGWFFNLKTLEKISKLKPVVWTLHDMWAITPHCAHSFDCELKKGFYQCPSLNSYPRIAWHNEKYLTRRKRNIYKNSNIEIVVPSLWLKKEVESSVLGDKNIRLIYNGVDINIFKKSDKIESRKELNIPLDKKVILFISDGGKNNPYKGWEYVEKIIKKFKERDDMYFICIGGDNNLLYKQDSNVHYVPKISDPAILAKYYSSADFFLYPSLADSFGLVVAESMSCGTPVLTFETGGILEIVEHKINGYIAKYRDTEDLIIGLEYLLNLSEFEYNIMSDNSIKRIKDNFTEEKMIEKYVELYNSLRIKDK